MNDIALFTDRKQAGMELASLLKEYKGSDAVVLAIPRGGLPLGAMISESLDLPLDVVLSKKIGHPTNKEYAIGAISLHGRILSENAREVSQAYVEKETKRIRKLLKERDALFHRKKKALPLRGRTVILVDDGIATGSTVQATMQLLRQEGCSEVILAIPVAPASVIRKLANSNEVDRIICPHQPRVFFAIGQFYERFEQVSDEEAIRILENNE